MEAIKVRFGRGLDFTSKNGYVPQTENFAKNTLQRSYKIDSDEVLISPKNLALSQKIINKCNTSENTFFFQNQAPSKIFLDCVNYPIEAIKIRFRLGPDFT